ncbi:hypothetical protein [Microvirga ossetica]|nr:hypothetical protein [Microvirga ossetica]
MTTNVFDPSPTLKAVLADEIGNDRGGGVSPTTVIGALDSLD